MLYEWASSSSHTISHPNLSLYPLPFLTHSPPFSPPSHPLPFFPHHFVPPSSPHFSGGVEDLLRGLPLLRHRQAPSHGRVRQDGVCRVVAHTVCGAEEASVLERLQVHGRDAGG